MSPAASIVVPTRGGRGRLPVLFGSLAEQTENDFETIVVCDGDIDNSAGLVEEWADRLNVRSIVFDQNRGRSEALNAGFADGSGRVLVRCDDDLQPGPTFVAHHVAHHRGAPVGVIGVCPDVYPESTYARVYGRRANRLLHEYWSSIPPDRTWRSWSANVSVTRETFDRVGGYDPAYRRYGWEDIDWGYRLSLLGVPIVIAHDIDADHHNPSTSTADRAVRAYLSGASRRLFERKHGRVLDTDPEGPPGLWGRLVSGLAGRLTSEERVLAAGRRVDRWLDRVPAPVATKLVAAVVEAAGVAATRNPRD